VAVDVAGTGYLGGQYPAMLLAAAGQVEALWRKMEEDEEAG
jgi:hypothetical protein